MNKTVQTLLAIEAIKSLKARYFRCMDCKDWAGLGNCFTEDLHADFRDGPGMLVEGRDDYIAQIQEILKDATTVHHGHMPEIDICGEDWAKGIWAMDDIVEMRGMSLRGWGHYHEEYRRVGGQWKIARIRLTRLYLKQNGIVSHKSS